jgi:hypothetical protein
MTAMAGFTAVVLLFVAFLGFTRSGFPDSNDPAAKIAAYFTQHRDAALTQQFLFGLALAATGVFIAGVVLMMWRVEETRLLGVIAAVGGAAAGGAAIVSTGLVMTLAYRPPVGDPGLMRTMLDAGYITLNTTGFVFALFIGAAALAASRAHVFPAWTAPVGLVTAALQLLGAAALVRGDGGMSPQGWVPILALLSFAVWVLSMSTALLRAHEVATPAPTAPTTPAPA